MTSGLTFAQTGQTLRNLTVAVGAANAVRLASDLVVEGTTTLTSGTLDISNVDLTIGGALTGAGQIATNATSGLTINTIGGLSTPLQFTGGTIGDLTTNIGQAGSITLGSDLIVANMLDLNSGTLILNGNDLTIVGGLASEGVGTISSTATSSINILSGAVTAGRLAFDAAANTVNDLTIAVGSGNVVNLTSAANIVGDLTLTSGRLDIANNILAIASTGTIVGGNATSFIQTGVAGAVSMVVNAGASAATVFPVGTATGFFPANISLQPGSGSGTVNVGAITGVFAQGTTGSLISDTEASVNNTWNISSNIASNLRMNMELAWQAAAEVNGFNRTQAYISHYTNSAWDANATGAASVRADGMYSLQRSDVQSLSPFAIFDGTTSDVASEVASNYNVYPSPATDVVVIESLVNASAPTTIDIVDAQGRIVASSVMMPGGSHIISVNALSTGVYFIKLHNASSVTTKSFIKI
ncbi:MAG: T9SS type A sorting domain-containing protein [bacterium]|nr:T9SS type A sorting domain-containing protein [bacterium]